jgi:type IV pilus assembly protein PilC
MSSDFDSEILIRFILTLLLLVIWLVVIGGILFLIHFLLTLPMRRAEQARLFLELIESALKRGQPIEEAIVSVSQSREKTFGVRFHMLAACLEEGLRFNEALAKVPRLLPPQVLAMLKVGQQIGDVRKVLPACRQLLKDAVSQTRGAINYVVILVFVITPAGFLIFSHMMINVMPRFLEVSAGMEGGQPTWIEFLFAHRVAMVLMQIVLLLVMWLTAFIYIGGPRLVSWLPVLERIDYWLPWRRKRMQRDFSTMLALLLDSGVPEPEAVKLAADCTANKNFQRRSSHAVDCLRRGMRLTEAIQVMDKAGEFHWRLTNASHAHAGFLRSLAGWHESLNAKAFQQEQAAAHGITTALVLLNGLFVGVVVISVFLFLISLINAGVLW